jgi:hypothetical protein
MRPSIPLAGRFYFMLCVFAVLRAQLEKLDQDFNVDGTTTIFSFPVICDMGAPCSMDGKDYAFIAGESGFANCTWIIWNNWRKKRRKDWGL